ncbi:MAG: M20 family metallopeptidase [Desulfobacterales bacterium]|nr:M20 family metallopeptidase [Desulfobacterales bacterium]
MYDLIASRYDQFISDLETIVNIDSGSHYPEGLNQVANFFRQRFDRIGWTTTHHAFDDGKVPCLEVSNRPPEGDDAASDLLFIGHMDTVFKKGTASKRPFSKDDKRAYGPGVCDMKGGLVAMLHVAEILQQTGTADSVAIAMAFNSDEEIGSRVSRPWYESLATRSRCVFVFEPWRATGERLLHRKGGGVFHVTCHGRAAHAGVAPEDGANAVIELAHQILAIKDLARDDIGTTVNVTVVSGGTAANVIPDTAKASVDVRIAEPDEAKRIQDGFQAISNDIQTADVRVEVTGGINRMPMVPSEKTLQLWEQIKTIGEAIGIDMRLTSTGGCSDGNFTAALGIPTIDAMGIRGGGSHGLDEYIELDSIVPNVHLVCEIVKGFADGRIS